MPMNLPTILTGRGRHRRRRHRRLYDDRQEEKYRQAAQEKSWQSGAGRRGHRGEYFQHHGLM